MQHFWEGIRKAGPEVRLLVCAALLVCASQTSNAADGVPSERDPQVVEHAADTAPADRVALFGDLHVHTELSIDAYMFGTREGPDTAYRYAKGEAVPHPSGITLQLEQPLDFEAVTDHAGYLGMPRAMNDPKTGPGQHELGKRLQAAKTREDRLEIYTTLWAHWDPRGEMGFADPGPDFVDDLLDMDIVRSAWQEVIEAAEAHNQPGEFTTFVGYEFTATGTARQNLHRNVIFRDSRVPAQPFGEIDSNNPEDLWDWMDARRAEGIEALAIPHNSNGSDGMMFARTDSQGRPIDAAYAAQRMRNEPLVEITQIKGTSDTHPLLSPNDEWADFELMEVKVATSQPSRPEGSYVRRAYLDGLEMEQTRGVNPYRFGLVGASDNHVAAAPFDESRFFDAGRGTDGKLLGSLPMSVSDEGVARYADVPMTRSASGLTGVWAEENTRDSIYAALRRKESFATSGPRMRLRFFAGYGWDKGLAESPDAVAKAYAGGVSMGGDLPAKSGESPSFLVWAMRDPTSAKLQRLQVVKGWVEDGKVQERVYDVACSDGLVVDPATQRCPDNGASVQLEDCSISADVGADELRTLWRDPDFDADAYAVYYVRALENPTCRWSTWQAVRAGSPPRPDWHATIQERAWSSPIWYVP